MEAIVPLGIGQQLENSKNASGEADSSRCHRGGGDSSDTDGDNRDPKQSNESSSREIIAINIRLFDHRIAPQPARAIGAADGGTGAVISRRGLKR